MPRFSLRDLFWLTLLVANGCAWWIDHHTLVRQVDWMRSLAHESIPGLLPLDGYMAVHLAMWIALVVGLLHALNIHVRAAIEMAMRPRNDF